MRDGTRTSEVKLASHAWWWFGILVAALLSSLLLSRSDDVTELAPDHSDILGYTFMASGVMIVVSMAIAWHGSRGPVLKRVLGILFGFGLFGGIASLCLFSRAVDIAERRHDFPVAATRTYPALLPIHRAYRADHRDGSTWTIQPVIWTNIDIAHSDYQIMLGGGQGGDSSKEPDRTSTPGRYCARVTMAQSRSALGVMHAGGHTLPAGSVGICSNMIAKEPDIYIATCLNDHIVVARGLPTDREACRA